MNPINRALTGLTLALGLTLGAGCMENIALIGRPALQLDQEEIFAEIVRVDTGARQLHLRPEDGRTRAVRYSADARVLHRGREYSMARLENGDKVSMQIKRDSRGDSYTDLIRVQEISQDRRVQETSQDRNQSRRGDDGRDSRIQTLDGLVDQIDPQRRSFEIRDQNREPVIVSLPSDAQRPVVDRFRALREGDYVQIEGRFIDRQRFELAGFVRDNR